MSQGENRPGEIHDEPAASRLGYRVLKAVLIILVAGGVVFLWKFAARRTPPDLAPHRGQLRLLEESYALRQERIRADFEEKIRAAPNEVLSVKYQQEENQELNRAEDLYFADKEAIARGDYRCLPAHWGEEIKRMPKSTTGTTDR
jgi:hypothetical protein